MNTDGCIKEKSYQVACSEVVQNEYYWVLGFCEFIRVCTSFQIELCTVKECLGVAREKAFTSLHLKADSHQVALQLIRSGDFLVILLYAIEEFIFIVA